MATPHRPCYDGWSTSDLHSYDRISRIDLSIHLFTNGQVSCSLLPVCTASAPDLDIKPCAGIESLLTVVVTSSPIKSNPSTRLLLECLQSLDKHGALANCRKLIMCDGFKVRKTSQRKQGIVTDDEAELYREYVNEVARLCREHPLFRRTRLVRLARRQGSAYAIREAIDAHVQTPFVIIVPHDCVIARPVNLDAVATAMHKHPGQISYVKIVGRSTLNYAEAVQSQYGVKLQPLTNMLPDGLTLLPMLRYMDNVAIVSVRYLKEVVYHPSSAVRRATFIEDTFGKQTQMHEWLDSAAFAAKLPPMA